MSKREIKHPKGYWMGVGISIGVVIGVALGPIIENFGAGIGVGIAIGAGIGASLEQKYKYNIRPLTEQEQKRQKLGVVIGLVLFGIWFWVLSLPISWCVGDVKRNVVKKRQMAGECRPHAVVI